MASSFRATISPCSGSSPSRAECSTAADDLPAAAPAAVMSYRAWEQNYALDPAVIGATFVLNGVAYTIAGISPPGFFGDTLRANPPDFWLPLGTEPALRGKNTLLRDKEQRWLYLVGRVRSGTLPAALEAKVNVELNSGSWRTATATSTCSGSRSSISR